MQFAADLVDADDRHFYVPLDLAGHLAEVHFRNEEDFRVFELRKGLLRERPDRADPEEPDVLVFQIVHHLLDGPHWAAIGNEDPAGVRVDDIVVRHIIAGVLDLVDQALHQVRVQLRVRGTGIAPFIMGEPGDMDMVTFAELGKAGDEVRICPERQGAGNEGFPVNPLNLIGDDDLLPHVPDRLVCHQKDRHPILVSEVEGFHRKLVHLLHGCRAERNDRYITVGAEPHLHHVALCRHRGLAGGGTAPLDVDDHAGSLGHDGKPDVLHHQGETGAARCGHGPGTGP